MKIRLLFFSTMRKRLGMTEKELVLDGPKKVSEVYFDLFDDRELAQKLFRSIRFAVNCDYVDSDTLIHDGDELAFIPPVSGG